MEGIPADYHDRHILLSGGSGYIGGAVVQALVDIPCTLTVVDQQAPPQWLPEKARGSVRWHQGDVTDEAVWQELVRDVDSIWHLAAIEAPYSLKGATRDWEVNARSVLHIAEAARAQAVTPHVVLASSANIYGHVAELPVNEETRDNPGRVWSAHKLLAEQYLAILSERIGFPATVLRLANVYGPAAVPESDAHIAINKVMRIALETDTLTVFANANCVRDYLYITDAVAAFLAAGSHPPPSFARYVVGSGEAGTIEQTWRLMAQVLQNLTQRDVALLTDRKRELDQAEYRHFVADSRRFAAATGWRANTSLKTGLAATAEWLLAHHQ